MSELQHHVMLNKEHSWVPCYIKSEADEVIAGLKDKCQMHDFFWEGCGFAKRGFKNAIAVSEAFDKLDTENRVLKRALWLSRAMCARVIQKWWLQVTCGPITEVACRRWSIVERKCLAKAEEYR